MQCYCSSYTMLNSNKPEYAVLLPLVYNVKAVDAVLLLFVYNVKQ